MHTSLLPFGEREPSSFNVVVLQIFREASLPSARASDGCERLDAPKDGVEFGSQVFVARKREQLRAVKRYSI